MSDNEMLKKYGMGNSNGSKGHIPTAEEAEQDFAELLGRISGKVEDLQSEIDDHDRIKKGRG